MTCLSVTDPVLERVTPFYATRRVLVTGGASFIGSHLVEALLAAGAEVTVVDDLSSGTLENLNQVREQIELIQGDLREARQAEQAAKQQSVVFHLAAAHGGRGYIDTHPVECLSNVVLDNNVFAAAVAAGVEKVVFASSACVYPTDLQADDARRLQLREEQAGFERSEQVFPDGEYGWAKLTGELLLRAVHRQFGITGICCRLFTVYGEREKENHAVIALIAKTLAKLDPFPVWGNGHQTRNFTHVGDTVGGLLVSGAALRGFAQINIGRADHVTINELLDALWAVVDWRPENVHHELDKPTGVRSRSADLTRCRQLLGWEPDIDLITGLTRTTNWYGSAVVDGRLENLDSLLMTR